MADSSPGPSTTCQSKNNHSAPAFNKPAPYPIFNSNPMLTKKQSFNRSMRYGTIAKTVFAILTLNSLFLFANGLFMLAEPKQWFFLIPGVKFTGGFNQHFVRDIGLVQMFLGA